MKRTIELNLNVEPPLIYAGYMGEHNATVLHITPPTMLSDSDYFRAAFDLSGIVIYSEQLTGDTLTVILWKQLTQQKQISMTLEGYKDDGSDIGKSQLVTLMFREAVFGTDGESDTNPHGMAVDVAANTARHTHDNKPTLNKLSEVDATLMFSGQPIGGTSTVIVNSIDDLDPAAPDGSLAVVRGGEITDKEPETFVDLQLIESLYLNPHPPHPDDILGGQNEVVVGVVDSRNMTGLAGVTISTASAGVRGKPAVFLISNFIGDEPSLICFYNITTWFDDDEGVEYKAGWYLAGNDGVEQVNYTDIPKINLPKIVVSLATDNGRSDGAMMSGADGVDWPGIAKHYISTTPYHSADKLYVKDEEWKELNNVN